MLIKHRQKPLIKTNRLILKEISLKEVDEMFEYRSNDIVQKYQSFRPKSKAEIIRFIKQNTKVFNMEDTWYQLGIYVNEIMIGDIGIHFLGPDNKQCEIGYTISQNEQRKGYGKEAVIGLVDYLFCKMGKHRIIASLDPDNEASKKLLESIGFRNEGLFKKSIYEGNKWNDDLVYALLEEEWSN
jgi:RimJ/RimL family protein N-acetyltransferase